MGGSAAKIKTPDDPDPSPSITTDSSADIQTERRETKKKASSTYGRQQTILAGSNTQNAGNKKTILGG